LQQNLVVREDGKKFAVVAGGRRLKALQLLAKAGDIKATHPVPCGITEAHDASEISLAENVMREDMHPADQFEAFRSLVDNGMPVADIAARFGKSEVHVVKILKLARVSPKLLKAYRAGELTLEHVMAFTMTDDHDAQEQVFASAAPWQEARDIRAALTENDIAATDKRVKFVTLKAYEKAGGKLKRDLFSDDDSGVYIEDLACSTRSLPSDSRNWRRPSAPKAGSGLRSPPTSVRAKFQYRRIHAEPVPLTKRQQKAFYKLQEEYDQINDA